MRKTIFIILTISSFLCLISIAKGITIDPDVEFIVENETYMVQSVMDFSSITIAETYIIFNSTGFYISSDNNIFITLIYLHNEINGADDGEKILEFYAETSSGTVWFNISGFPMGNEYIINRDSIPMVYSTADSFGFISYNNSNWSTHHFEITQTATAPANNPPVVGNIPDQEIIQGEIFSPIFLDDYVTDSEDPDEDISWSYDGNSELNVSIINRVATVTIPYPEWVGEETVTFTARDTGGLSDSDDAMFTVTIQMNPPGGDNPPPGGGGSPPPEGGDEGGEDNTTDDNFPPEAPVTPSGPSSIELGIEYSYSSFTFDPDGDLVRFRFDWGDSTYSDWSEFVPSNTSIIMSHQWNYISVFEVQVIAQDEQGENSSWSEPLEVIVSQMDAGDEPSIIPKIVLADQTYLKKGNVKIVFDASGSIDPEGVIKSYQWDFGDGKTGRGVQSVHIYKNLGEYFVTLIITDEFGNEYSKSIIIYLASEDEGRQAIVSFYPENGVILLLIFGVAGICFMFFLKKPIRSCSLRFTSRKIRKINARIDRMNSSNKERSIICTTSITAIEQFCDKIPSFFK